ncbi:MAG TPA: hypothetical protein VGM68_08355 [Rhizomicrobium sp.]|jgi:hypothetical protein
MPVQMPEKERALRDYKLSRAYAKGWNAARGRQADAAANPYPADPERARWHEGFTKAAG